MIKKSVQIKKSPIRKTLKRKSSTKKISIKKVRSLKAPSIRKKVAARRKSERSAPIGADLSKRLRRSIPQNRSNYLYLGIVALMIALVLISHFTFRVKSNESRFPVAGVYNEKVKTSSDERSNSFQGSRLWDEEFRRVHGLTLGERIDYWSSFIENSSENRRKIEEFANGIHWNDDEVIIPSKYNCTTFVETVAALARSNDSRDFLKQLLVIRYQGGVASFKNRNHFPEADWIPNNEKSRTLKDITTEVALSSGIKSQIERKTINRAQWLDAQVRRHAVTRRVASIARSDWEKSKEVQVHYIKISQVDQVLSNLPSGVILNVVHKNSEKHPVLITHQGILIRKGDHMLLRHAPSPGKIKTVELKQYLDNLLKHEKADSQFPLIGINLVQINDL